MAWKKIGEGLYQDTTTGAVGTLKKNSGGGLFVASETTRTNYQKEKMKSDIKGAKENTKHFKRMEQMSSINRQKEDYHERWSIAQEEERMLEKDLELYDKPREYEGKTSDLKGKHIPKDRIKEDTYVGRKMEQYKEKKEQETYTKTGNIRYNAFGIERTPEGDFSDDGTRFTAYRLPNGMEMTVAKDSNDIYLSVRSPYNKEIKYEEYSKLPGYKELDMYNGVSKSSVDLNEVIKNSNTYKNAYNDLLKKKGLKPDTRTNKQIRIDSIKDRIDSNNINIKWYQNNNDYSRWRYNRNRINQLMKQNEKLRKELEKISK